MACNLTSSSAEKPHPTQRSCGCVLNPSFFDGAEAVSGRGGDDVGEAWVIYCNLLMAPMSAWGEDGGDQVNDILTDVGG